jgi:hypothetical protein
VSQKCTIYKSTPGRGIDSEFKGSEFETFPEE